MQVCACYMQQHCAVYWEILAGSVCILPRRYLWNMTVKRNRVLCEFSELAYLHIRSSGPQLRSAVYIHCAMLKVEVTFMEGF